MTATNDQATRRGFTLPQGTDAIRNGDDAIRANALAAVTQLLALEDRATRIESYAVIASPSKNLYNPADPDAAAGYTLANFTPAASAAYTLTGFIRVTAGAKYALSNPRNWAFYDRDKVAVAGSSGASSTSAATVLTAPDTAMFLRASYLTATYGSSFQVEAGGTVTGYVPYALTLPGISIPPDTTPVTPARTTFAVASRNLFDPSAGAAGYSINASTGAPSALAGYTVTGFIPVSGGAQITLSNARNVAFYTTAKAYLGSTAGYVNNATSAPATVTVPTSAGFLRASFAVAYAGTFQVEAGPTTTAYVPYGISIPSLQVALPRAGAMRVTRAGAALTVTTDLDGQALQQTMTLSGSNNGAFSWTGTSLAGVARHVVSDSITPLRTSLGTIGANHGYSQPRSFANPDGKTTADLGSQWTDGTTTFTLVQIDTAGLLVLAAPAAVDGAGIVTAPAVAPTADLTHVSGATHTGTIAKSSMSATYQLWPSVRDVSVVATLDGGVIPAGDSTGQTLRITESYVILDYADLLAKAQANVGTPYTALDVAGAVRVSIVYEMRAPGTWVISASVTALKPQTLGQCGFVQAEAMTIPAGGSLIRTVPGVKTIGTRSWSSGVDLTSYTDNQVVTPGDLVDATKPPTFAVDWLRDSAGRALLGFAMGYVPDKTAAGMAARAASGASNYWDLRGTKKSYPTAFTALSLAAGQKVQIEAFRSYLPPSTPRGFTIRDARDGYAFIIAAAAIGAPAPMPAELGRTVTTLAAQGLTAAAGVVDADGITVNGTGSLVARLA